MSSDGRLSNAMRWLLAGACFVIIVAGARAAEPILVPLLLAAMLAIICVPPMQWLKGHGFPGWLAIVLVVLFVLAVGTAFGTVIGTSLIDFSASLPYYQARLQTESNQESVDTLLEVAPAVGLASDAASERYCEESETADPNAWLACILDLEQQGLLEAAMVERDLLRESFPDAQVPTLTPPPDDSR